MEIGTLPLPAHCNLLHCHSIFGLKTAVSAPVHMVSPPMVYREYRHLNVILNRGRNQKIGLGMYKCRFISLPNFQNTAGCLGINFRHSRHSVECCKLWKLSRRSKPI